MRLDFNVLWVDDQPGRVASQIYAIRGKMGEQGFEFNAEQCRSLADVEYRISDEVFNDDVDLILVDWDLGGDTHGQDAILKIREVIPYKDIVFYSARTGVDELRRLAADNRLEGIYCATRDELVDEVMGVFEALIKKVLDLDHTRGIVMGATSDIEFMVLDSLSALHDLLDDNGKQSLVQTALKRIREKLGDMEAMVVKLQNPPTLQVILESRLVFSAYDSLRLLANALDMPPLNDQFGSRRAAVTSYMENVLPDRNILGHQILTPEGKPVAVVRGDGRQVDIDEMRELRRLLLDLRREFRELHGALRS